MASRALFILDSDRTGQGMFRMRRCTLDEHIKSSIRSLLLTRKGERALYPEMGSLLFESLFRPSNGELISETTNKVRDAIRVNEPRVEVTDVEVLEDKVEKGRLKIEVRYQVLETQRPGQVVVSVEP
jgi:phage baseplate assembly protein W